ncbi:MAG: hypothetical protein M1822_008207 [Bathelium mastoideum]|nr:MAG: hypothetical protein M1822_008207 [Bathelium mastoideum]
MSGAEFVALVGVFAAVAQLTVYCSRACSVFPDRLEFALKGPAILDKVFSKASNLSAYIETIEAQYVTCPEILCTLKDCAAEARLLIDYVGELRSAYQGDRKRDLAKKLSFVVFQESVEARIAKHLKRIRQCELDLILFMSANGSIKLVTIGDDISRVKEIVERVDTKLDNNDVIAQKKIERNLAALETLVNDRLGKVERTIEGLSVLLLDSPGHSAERRFQTATVSLQPRNTGMKNRTMGLGQTPNYETFFGYKPQLDKLAQVLKCGQAAIVGLPGVGKTRLIEEFLNRFQSLNGKVVSFWIDGTTEETFKQDFAQIPLSDLVTVSNDLTEIPEDEGEEQQTEGHPMQMIVIDGIYRTELTYTGKKLISRLKMSENRRVLFSATNDIVVQNLIPADTVVSLPGLDAGDGQQLLLQRIGLKTNKLQGSLELAKMLSYHPLAICQAASYLLAVRFDMVDCLRCFEEHDSIQTTLLQHNVTLSESGTGSTTCVKSLWISFKYLGKSNAFAIEVLKMMSCFHYMDVTVKLLPLGASAFHLRKALGLLESMFTIIYRGERERFDLHPLVRLAVRSQLQSTGRLHRYLDMALSKVLEYFPVISGDNGCVSAFEITLLPHARSILKEQLLQTNVHSRKKLSRLAIGVAIVYKQYGKFGLALEFIECALRLIHENDDIVFRATARHHQAIVLHRLGRLSEAERVAVDVHQERKEMLGQWHQETLASLNNLGLIYISQARLDLAEKTLRAALDGKVVASGENERRVMISMINLGEVLQSREKYEEAEQMFMKVVEWRKEHLGEKDMATLSAISHLATAFQGQKRWEDAWERHNEALNGRCLTLGRAHPSTLRSQANLASILQSQGLYSQAEDLLKQVHKSCLDAQGEKSPSMVLVMRSMASVIQDQGRYQEAATISQKALSLSRKILGSEHPKTKACREKFDELRPFQITYYLGEEPRGT